MIIYKAGLMLCFVYLVRTIPGESKASLAILLFAYACNEPGRGYLTNIAIMRA